MRYWIASGSAGQGHPGDVLLLAVRCRIKAPDSMHHVHKVRGC
jgi:hypothetical protein